MTDLDRTDARLAQLLADRNPPASDNMFAERVVALASYELRLRQSRRRGFAQVGREALALVAVLASFVALARLAPDAAGMGDSVPFGSPAMLGLLMLLGWGVVATRDAASAR
jgi:hypothetical protein